MRRPNDVGVSLFDSGADCRPPFKETATPDSSKVRLTALGRRFTPAVIWPGSPSEDRSEGLFPWGTVPELRGCRNGGPRVPERPVFGTIDLGPGAKASQRTEVED